MKCSIVITTINKPTHLDRVLTSIYSQRVEIDYEVIVVDDGDSTDTKEVCQKYARTCGLKVLHTGNTKYRNPSVARNVGYRVAKGEVIICQCDDVLHVDSNVIMRLVTELKPGEFLLAKCENWEYEGLTPVKYIQDYCSKSKRSVPYFFCGAVAREDLYAVGGNDEEFVEPCYDDNWFADCLIKGRGLKPRHDDSILTHHIRHGYPVGSHKDESKSKKLYQDKVAEANKTGVWQSSGGSWLSSKKIPKCMNFFWAGSSMSWLRYLTIKSFRVHNPDWRVKLFVDLESSATKGWSTPEEQDYHLYSGVDYSSRLELLDVEVVDWVSKAKNLAPAHASDLFQWSLLSSTGGFYSDMDILFVRPMPNVLSNDVVYCNSKGLASIGFLGASPDNKVFGELLECATRNYDSGEYQSTGANAMYLAGGVNNRSRLQRPGDMAIANLCSKYNGLRCLRLEDEAIYPWAWNETSSLWTKEFVVPDQCICIHWFAGDTLSQKMNNTITPDNVRDHPCTISRYARYLA